MRVLPCPSTTRNRALHGAPAAGRGRPTSRGWIVATLLTWAAGGSAACGSPSAAPPYEHTGAASAAIYGGVLDDDGAANSAVVALTVGASTANLVLCTGTLIAPNVVLTAHHCVGSNLAPTLTCDDTGTSATGAQIGADVNPSIIHVFVGAQPDLTSPTPDAVGAAIFDTESTTLCNADIAVVLLDRNIPSITPLAVRLSGATRAGETVRAVGFGQNDQGSPTGTRFRRDGVSVLATGAEVSPSGTALGSNEMELGTSTCEGDSGGPAISEESGAIVGVVSRGGGCGDDFGHVYTMTAGFASLLTTAMAAAGEAPLEEVISSDGGPAPPTGSGSGASPPSGAADSGAPAMLPSKPSPSPDAGPWTVAFGGTQSGSSAGACAARIASRRSTNDSPDAALVALAALGAYRRRRRRRGRAAAVRLQR